MTSIKDVLSKLNKNKAEADKIGFLDKMPEDFLSKGFVSIGSPYLDYKTGGGHNRTGMTLITGWESAGKSSLLLTSVKRVQEEFPDKTPVIFDGEGSINQSAFDRMGVNSSNLIMVKEKNLEAMLDQAEAFSLADDVSMICIDSVKAFYSSTEEAKSAEEYTIGISAKRWNTRIPIISANCFRRGIPIIIIHQWRQDPGKMMGDNRVLSGGLWLKYMPDLHLDLTKKDLILDERKKPIGHKMDVRIKKCKNASYNGTEEFRLNFFYTGGFNEIDEYVNIFVEEDVINASGSWLSYPDPDGVEVKLQGKDNVANHLKENEDHFQHLLKLLRDE